MTTIHDIGDLVRVLQEQPQWAEALRGVLLSRELLDLPERFAEFVELTGKNFKAVDARLGRLESDLSEFKVAVDARFQQVDERFDRMEGRMDNGFGTNYEVKAERSLASHAGQHLGLRRVRVLKGTMAGRDPALEARLERAVDEGVITWEEHDQLLLADLIFTGRERSGSRELMAVAEVSITAGDYDVDRVAERSRIMGTVTGQTVTAVVISANVDDERDARARERSVTAIRVPEQP